jgi:N-acyl-L-homoserine lactone synthetase
VRPQTRLDLLADEVLVDLAPLALDVARTAAEVDEVLRLRYACVVELGWSRTSDYPDGREHDEHDEGATFVLCRDGEELIGVTRLMPPVTGRPLLVEQQYGIAVHPAGEVLEAGRLVVPSRHRGARSHRIMTGLFARGWLAARELGFDRVVGQATPQLMDLYRGLGLEVVELGPSGTYFGEERVPIEITGHTDGS